MYFYYIEQNLYKLTAYQSNNTILFMFIIIFLSGMMTSLNPCLLSLLPIITSYINTSYQHFYKKHLFIFGLISSFLITITLTTVFNIYFKYSTISIPIISSLYMIFLGLNVLNIIELRFLKNSNNNAFSTTNNAIMDYAVGLLVGLHSSSCSTPILATIIFWVSQSKLTLISLLYILCYSLGYSLPIIILVTTTINFTKFLKVEKMWIHMILFSGSVVLGLGNLSLLSNIFT